MPRKCSWSPSCAAPPAGEWCEPHTAIMAPLFAVRLRRAVGGAAKAAALDRLDTDRAEVVARMVAETDGPLRLDGRSDALRRAVEVAEDAGWITSTRDGYGVGPVEVGRRRPKVAPSGAATGRPAFDPTRTVEMIVAYLERTDHAPSKAEIIAALNLTHGRMNVAAAMGRREGKFHSGRGLPGYRLGPFPAAEERHTAA